ncbi:hypothetical protein FRC00_004785, partial [Tulasnella sp. 408]
MPATRSARPASHRARPSSKPNHDPGKGKPMLRGYLDSLSDALIVIEAARRGLIGRVLSKPNDPQKELYTQSGNIIVFEESEVGIRRWTDPLGIEVKYAPGESRSTSSDSLALCPPGRGVVTADTFWRTVLAIDYVEDVLSGNLMRPSEMVSDKLKQLPDMIPVGDLIDSISEDLLDDSLYSHKGRNCLLITERGRDGRLVYAGETDEGSSKYKRRPLTIEADEDEDEVQESANSSTTHFPSHDAIHAAISHYPASSWTGRYSQAPYFSSEPSASSPTVPLSPPPAYFNAVHYPPAPSPSSCSITTLASFSGQGWELDDTQSYRTDPSPESWAHQRACQLPPTSGLHSSLPVLDMPESSSGGSVTAWPLPSDANLLWGESRSFGFAPFDSPSDQASYQLQAVGELDDASASFGQFAPLADIEHQAIAGMDQATQHPDTWWNGVGNVLYGDAWNQTI